MYFKIIVLNLFLLMSLFAQTPYSLHKNVTMKTLEYEKAVASYVNGISKKIAQQLSHNSRTKNLKSLSISILPITNLYDANQTTLATRKIDENLIHEMFLRGYTVVDNNTMNKIERKKHHPSATCVLFLTYSNYKNGMLINARIIDTNSSVVHTTAQVFVNKSELKSINKLYNKYGWFSE